MIEKCKFCKRFVEAKEYMRDPIISQEGKKIKDRRNCIIAGKYVTPEDGCEKLILSNMVWCLKRNQWMYREVCVRRWIAREEQECKRCATGKELINLVRKMGSKKRKRRLLNRKSK